MIFLNIIITEHIAYEKNTKLNVANNNVFTGGGKSDGVINNLSKIGYKNPITTQYNRYKNILKIL